MLIGDRGDGRQLVLIGVLLAGCSRGPTGVNPPKWDPAAAAGHALSEYDANHDQKLSRDELKKCPGLLSALKLFDIDGEGTISAEELNSKLKDMREQQAALVEVPCLVTRGGKPLEGATVTFVPEAFMGEAFKSSTGVSGPDGTVLPSIAEEDLPKELRGRVHGVRCGVFRVTVTHPQIPVPARFNTQTEIGWVFVRRRHETLNINL